MLVGGTGIYFVRRLSKPIYRRRVASILQGGYQTYLPSKSAIYSVRRHPIKPAIKLLKWI